MARTIYACFDTTTRKYIFKGEACDDSDYEGCFHVTGVDKGKLEFTFSEELCAEDTYYACWNPVLGKYQAKIPSPCCCTESWPGCYAAQACWDPEEGDLRYVKAVFSDIVECSGVAAGFDMTCINDPAGFLLIPFWGAGGSCEVCAGGETSFWLGRWAGGSTDPAWPWNVIGCCGDGTMGGSDPGFDIEMFVAEDLGQYRVCVSLFRHSAQRTELCEFGSSYFSVCGDIDDEYSWAGTYNNYHTIGMCGGNKWGYGGQVVLSDLCG